MVKTQRIRRRNQAALRAAIVSASLLLVGLGVYQLATTPQSSEFNYGSIACSEVQKTLADYQGRPMPADLSERVALHLEQCESCRKHRDAMRMGQQQAARSFLTFASRHRISCDCGHCLRRRPTLVASR